MMGVPVILGKNGIEKILPLSLHEDEKAAFEKSSEAVRAMNKVLTESGII
jgi:malate dehydrogenase